MNPDSLFVVSLSFYNSKAPADAEIGRSDRFAPPGEFEINVLIFTIYLVETNPADGDALFSYFIGIFTRSNIFILQPISRSHM